MRAIRLTGPVDIDGLSVSDVPLPEVRPGWVRLRVMAFGGMSVLSVPRPSGQVSSVVVWVSAQLECTMRH
jgi:hypothetical protein